MLTLFGRSRLTASPRRLTFCLHSCECVGYPRNLFRCCGPGVNVMVKQALILSMVGGVRARAGDRPLVLLMLIAAAVLSTPRASRADLVLSTNPTNAFADPLRLTFDNQGSPAFSDGTITSALTGTDRNHFINSSFPIGQLVNRYTTTDTRFQQFGIASISVLQAKDGTNLNSLDSNQVFPGMDVNEATGPSSSARGDGRGLFFNGQGLFLDTYQQGVTLAMDPTRQTFLRPEFTINLIGDHQRFGFSFADRSNTTMRVEAYLNGTLVDSLTFQYTETAVPVTPEYFVVSVASSTQFFDQILIYQPMNQSDNGWGIDDLTVEATAVPEPSSLLLAGIVALGVAGYGRFRQRRRQVHSAPQSISPATLRQ